MRDRAEAEVGAEDVEHGAGGRLHGCGDGDATCRHAGARGLDLDPQSWRPLAGHHTSRLPSAATGTSGVGITRDDSAPAGEDASWDAAVDTNLTR
jgi:hypothetical protein